MNSKLYVSLLVVATLAVILMAAESATAYRMLINKRICNEESDLEGCRNCCASNGYQKEETTFYEEDKECCCLLRHCEAKMRKSDMLYDVSQNGNVMTLIKGAERDAVLPILTIV